MEKKRIHLKQKHGYGCGLFSLANLLQDEKIVTEERLKESETGNNFHQLNKWLLEDGYNMFIEALYFSSIDNRIPDNICEIIPNGDDVIALPVLIDIQNTEDSKMHLVTAEIIKDGSLIVVDSLKENIEVTTLKQYQENFFRVFGLWYLRPIKGEGYFMRCNN